MTRSLVTLALLCTAVPPLVAQTQGSGTNTEGESAPPAKTLEMHLKAAVPPVFRAGHTLPHLTRWGWAMPYEVRVELTEKWGYALEFGAGYVTEKLVDDVEKDVALNPSGVNAKVLALASSDPRRYPLAVVIRGDTNGSSYANLPEAVRATYDARAADGKPVPDPEMGKGGPSWRTVSPLASDAIFVAIAEDLVRPLLRLNKLAPIAAILNGGEFGLCVEGHGRKFWEQDPAIMAAKGERTWISFLSEHKARQEGHVSDAVRAAFPDRQLYLWYHFGGVPSWDPDAWSTDAQTLGLSDYPDQSLYYGSFNSGWGGDRDLLSNFTFAVAQAIPQGHPLSYNWVCGGWDRDKPGAIADIDRYTGFLKCLYAAGQIGAVAGYFSLPEGCRGEPVGDAPPPHLQQQMALGHVHALFSHVEEFLRQGDLLPGPLLHKLTGPEHVFSAAGPPRDRKLPAYEFAPPADGAQVLVRKQRGRKEWLIVAWAATGEARDVTIDVPELGVATVRARPAGSVYLATSKIETPYEPPVVALDLLDADAMDPTARWR